MRELVSGEFKVDVGVREGVEQLKHLHKRQDDVGCGDGVGQESVVVVQGGATDKKRRKSFKKWLAEQGEGVVKVGGDETIKVDIRDPAKIKQHVFNPQDRHSLPRIEVPVPVVIPSSGLFLPELQSQHDEKNTKIRKPRKEESPYAGKVRGTPSTHGRRGRDGTPSGLPIKGANGTPSTSIRRKDGTLSKSPLRREKSTLMVKAKSRILDGTPSTPTSVTPKIKKRVKKKVVAGGEDAGEGEKGGGGFWVPM